MDAALMDILGGIGTLLVLAVSFGKVWKPRMIRIIPGLKPPAEGAGGARPTLRQTVKARSPFRVGAT
jgi:hypothetical protein